METHGVRDGPTAAAVAAAVAAVDAVAIGIVVIDAGWLQMLELQGHLHHQSRR